MPRYEHRNTPVLSRLGFVRRMALHAAVAGGFLGASLGVGMWGYAHFEAMNATDAFLNAAMILGGMGPVKTEGLSEGGKVFAGVYALYSGLAVIAVMGIMLTPVVHRVLHRFHWG